MYRKILFITIIIFTPLLAVAQSPSQYDPHVSSQDYGHSLSNWATGGVITNELDAAFNARETTAGPGFTDLTKPYAFGGVDNPFNLANTAVSSPFFTGLFIPGSLPFSFFFNFNHTDKVAQNEIEDLVGGTTRTYEKLKYDTINDQFQFLINLGMFTTGLLYVLDLDDNRVNADNYVDTGTTPDTVSDQNGSIKTHSFYVPAFFQTGMYDHYAELGIIVSKTDWSTQNDNSGSGIDYKNELLLFRPQLIYEIMFPLFTSMNSRNQFRSSIRFNVTKITHDPSGDANGDGSTLDDSYTSDYPLNLGLFFTAEMAMFFEAVQWVTMGITPTFNYSFTKISNGPESTTTNSVTTTFDKDHTTDSTILFSFPSAVEFLPDDWFIGLVLGVVPTFSYSATTIYDDANTPGVIKQVTRGWTTNVAHSYGLFIPIPGGYRMDITLGATGLWDFDALKLQLVVPLK